MRAILTFLILGIGAACIAFLCQAVLFGRLEWSYTAMFLLLLALSEEIPRFAIIILAQKKGLLPQGPALPAISYGVGFAIVEIFLASSSPILSEVPLFWYGIITLVHIFLSFIILFTVRKQTFSWIFAGLLTTICIHWGYNMLVAYMFA